MTPAQRETDRAAHHVRARKRLNDMGAVPPMSDHVATLNYAEAALSAAGCKECCFWARGQCRRHAPRAARAAGVTETVWPRTGPEDWCGEWYAA